MGLGVRYERVKILILLLNVFGKLFNLFEFFNLLKGIKVKVLVGFRVFIFFFWE